MALFRNWMKTSLPKGDVTVAVSHSTLNYKDGLIPKRFRKAGKNYPHIPGIDFQVRSKPLKTPIM